MLDFLCLIWQGDNQDFAELPWTHEDIKLELLKDQLYSIWWSNSRAADDTIKDIMNGRHWSNPRNNPNHRRYLRFSDTDGNDWSLIAENLLQMCQADRVWVHQDGDYEGEDDDRFEVTEDGREIRYID